jgi:hypothetical protein
VEWLEQRGTVTDLPAKEGMLREASTIPILWVKAKRNQINHGPVARRDRKKAVRPVLETSGPAGQASRAASVLSCLQWFNEREVSPRPFSFR